MASGVYAGHVPEVNEVPGTGCEGHRAGEFGGEVVAGPWERLDSGLGPQGPRRCCALRLKGSRDGLNPAFVY